MLLSPCFYIGPLLKTKMNNIHIEYSLYVLVQFNGTSITDNKTTSVVQYHKQLTTTNNKNKASNNKYK